MALNTLDNNAWSKLAYGGGYGDPNATLRSVYEQQEREYQNVYRPINRELIASVDSNELVNAAKKNAGVGFGATGQARTQRQLSRYGLDVSNLAAQEAAYAFNNAGRLNYIDSVNNAYIDQYERNTGLRDQMINVGRGLATSAQNNLSAAAQSQTAVENQNRAIEAQNAAARDQTIGAVVGTVLAAFMM